MRILCHRGLWKNKPHQNTLDALMAAINLGLGVETDIRDLDGNLVISHDPPRRGACFAVDDFFEAYGRSGRSPLLALNVKSDGLQALLADALRRHNIVNYFAFDMSLPDTVGYLKNSLRCATRLSEYEDGQLLLESTDTIWLDGFEGEWYSINRVSAWLDEGKRVCVVSPELHRRPHVALWQELSRVSPKLATNLYLCTDLINDARKAFNVIQD